jgi:hypothetical protein
MNVSKDRTKKNGLKKWCTPESIIEHGIVDCLLTHVPYQFTFKKFLIMELCQKGLKNVNVKMTMFIFTIELWFLVMAIIIGYEAQSTFFPWNIELST